MLEEIVTDYVSIGDYVLTGGELPAMIMIDAISSWFRGYFIMMCPPSSRAFRIICWNIRNIPDRKYGMTGKVPEILMSGHHANIEKWRREQSVDPHCKEPAGSALKSRTYRKRKKTGRRSAKRSKKNPCNLLQGMIKCSML